MIEAKDLHSFLKKRGFKTRVEFLNQGLVDGKISHSLNMNLVSYFIELCKLQKFDSIISLKYEMGHQDHDATSWVGRAISKILQIPHYEIPAYNKARKLFGYSVMNCQDSSNRVQFENNKSVFLSMIVAFKYRSQFKTWLGLFPFVLFRYFRKNFAFYIDAPFASITSRHDLTPLYEKRNKAFMSSEIHNLEFFKIMLKESNGIDL